MLDGFVVVYRAAGLTDGELVKGYLESEDIPADLDYESAGPTFGLTMDGLGEVRVCVPVSYEVQARWALAVRPVTGTDDTDDTDDTQGTEDSQEESA